MKHNHKLTKMSSCCGHFSVPHCLHINYERVDCESYFKGSLWLVAVERIPVELAVLKELCAQAKGTENQNC